MNSEEMIKILEYLGDKFGYMVDWTSENILPYAKDLINRIIIYKIAANAIGAVICLAVAIGCVFFIRYFCKSEDWSDSLILETAAALVLGFISLIGFIIIVFNIIQWCIVPELPLWDLVNGVV